MNEKLELDFSGLDNKIIAYNPLQENIPVVLSLVGEDNPILKQKTEKFDFSNPPVNPVLLYRNLGKTLIEHNALGLAAPQCGLPYRAFVMRAEEIIGVFNPIIVDKSEEEIILDEGCLSFNELILKIKRPKRIRVRYTQPDGKTVTKVFDGITARCFLHETDHLDGKVFKEYVSKTQLNYAETKRRKRKSTNG